MGDTSAYLRKGDPWLFGDHRQPRVGADCRNKSRELWERTKVLHFYGGGGYSETYVYIFHFMKHSSVKLIE